MASTVTIDLRHVARGLGVPLRQTQAVVELLDEGNTVPFIARYRKDQTGGLDEDQIRQIQARLEKTRLLADRKQTILRSIESQGKLTEELAGQIHGAGTTKRLEDLYLPYRPKKQTLATLARSRGLEPLAREILEAQRACADLDARAADFANPDRQVPMPADALLGAGHILAEQFSEQAELRQRLRDILQRTGRFVSSQVGGTQAGSGQKAQAEGVAKTAKAAEVAQAPQNATRQPDEPQSNPDHGKEQPAEAPEPTDRQAEETVPGADTADVPGAVAQQQSEEPPEAAGSPDPQEPTSPQVEEPTAAEARQQAPAEAERPEARQPPPPQTGEPASPRTEQPAPPQAAGQASPEVEAPASSRADQSSLPQPEESAAPTAKAVRSQRKAEPKPARLSKAELKKQRAEEKKIKAFRDYFDYREDIKKIPPHRVLAINRGERAKVLRVKIESDLEAMHRALDEMLVPPEHPHAEYLRGCARDALSRLILPSLEREIRRELTDRAEAHAVGVFARNLRNLLLQPPVRDCRVLAVDPGFKSGCKLAALDQFGNLLEHGVIYLVGPAHRRAEAKQKVVELVDRYRLSAVVIGNGTACRQTEDFFAEMITGELKDRDIRYVIVNEAGASVYSVSRMGREEFPDYDASLRGAISIGRRLQDPLSELVKIDAANIGVGLYQHDVKAKHLRSSLDEVVESCVNYVGVDVNTASPALLRYVSGLNQLTARRVCQHRREHGPFRNREQLREVPGLGEATFVQAAGFLKIPAGDNPLDATWIHPESYETAGRVLAGLGCTAADLTDKAAATAMAGRIAEVQLEETAGQLGVGALTLKDILAQLARPGRDPREDLPAPVFKQGVLKLEDLDAGMELRGTVLNVVDFGAFVDIGMHDSGLVHISQLADRFVRDPHEVVAVGDVVKVWVIEVDKERRRVSLTMVQPGSERQRPPRRGGKPQQDGQPQQEGPPAEGGGGRAKGRGRTRDQRDPKPKGRPRPKGPPGRRGPPKPKYRPKSRPKPVIPITDAMKTGKEPLRTFGDLAQYFEHQREDGRQEEAQDAKPAPPPTHDEPQAAPPVAPPVTDTTEGTEPEPPAMADTTQDTEPQPPARAEESPPAEADVQDQEPTADGDVGDTQDTPRDAPEQDGRDIP